MKLTPKLLLIKRIVSFFTLTTIIIMSLGPLALTASAATITSVTLFNPNAVKITYSGDVTDASVLVPANYALSGLTVIDVFQPDGGVASEYVVVGSGPVSPGVTTLTVSNVVGNTTDTAQAITVAQKLYISEMAADLDGGHEFIELYNAGSTAFDISNFVVGYDIPAAGSPVILATIPAETSIPAYSYYLLATEGFATTPDATFAAAMDLAGGSVSVAANEGLLGDGGTDTLSWGSYAGAGDDGVASAMQTGKSLERKAFGNSTAIDLAPGGLDAAMGNGWHSYNNTFDFVLQSTPSPQNASSAAEQPNMNDYQGMASSGPMITHMPVAFAGTGGNRVLIAQMGDPFTMPESLITELHYMTGDGSPGDNVVGDYTIEVGSYRSNGYFNFTIPQAVIDASTSYGLYYYFKVVGESGIAYMSQSPAADMAGVEATVAQNPFQMAIQDSAGWTKHNITGTVTDGTDPISGAKVFVEGTTYNTTSGVDGTFSIPGVKDGIYNVIIFEDGYYDAWVENVFLLGTNAALGTLVMSSGTGGGISGDTTKPFVIWSGPSDGMFGIPPNQENFKIFLGLSEDLDASTFTNSNVYLSTDGTTPIASTVAFDNNPADNAASGYPGDPYLGIISTPAGGLTENTEYFVILTGAVRDKAGNSLQGSSPQGGHSFSFHTGGDFLGGGEFDPDSAESWATFGSGEMMPPYVIDTIPTSGSKNMPPNVRINVKFSKMMDSSSVTTSGNIKLYKETIANNAVTRSEQSITTTIDTTQKTATVAPASSLTAGRYQLVVTGAVKSSNGVFAGDPGQAQNTSAYEFHKMNFEVGANVSADTTRPTVLGSYPANNATGIAVNPGTLMFQFSEAMAPGTISLNSIKLLRGTTAVLSEVSYDPVSQSAFLSPLTVLSPSTVYTLKATTSVTDSVGNAMLAENVVSFTTSATTDTSQASILYANGDESSIAITFTEPMNMANKTSAYWAKSILNPTNIIIKYGAPGTVAASGTTVNLANAQLSYDAPTNTLNIEGLGLTYAMGLDYYIDVTAGNVSGSGATDLSGNSFTEAVTFQMPMQHSTDTFGMLGPKMGMGGEMMGPNMGQMGMMPAGCFPQNGMAGQTSIYFCDIPITKALEDGGKIFLTFPLGFDVSGAKKANSPINNDINEWNAGVIAFDPAAEESGGANNDGVKVSAGLRLVSIDLDVTGTPPASDFIHFDLAGITNGLARNFNTGGYTIDVKITKANGSGAESIASMMPFYIFEGGNATLSGSITGIQAADVDGDADNVTVYLSSPLGLLQNEVAIADNGTGSYSFTGLMPNYSYGVFTDPMITLDSNDYEGKAMPDMVMIADGSNTKNIALVKDSATGKATITVDINGVFGTDDLDVFASNSNGNFKKKTITNAGTNPANVTLYLGDGDWYVGFGPAMSDMMSSNFKMPDWQIPANINVKVSGVGTVVKEASGTANDGTVVFTVASASKQIIGYVKDDQNNAIADAEVYAYQPNGTSMGSHSKTDTDGKFTLKVAQNGRYSIGVFKPGLPGTPDKSVDVKDNTGASDGNDTADIYNELGTLVTGANQFIFKIQKPAQTISGKLSDANGNAVPFAPVWAYQSNGYGHADTMTDSAGNYILYVNNGTWVLNGHVPGFGEAESQTVVINSADSSVNLSPASGVTYYTISGNISIDGTAQAYMPIRAVKYDASGNYLGKEYGSSTDASGNYVISAPGGEGYYYRVDIWTSGYGEVELDTDEVANNPANVSLTANKTSKDITIAAEDLSTITTIFTNGSADYEGFLRIEGVNMTDVNNPKPTGFNINMRVSDLSQNQTVKLKDGDYLFFLDVPGLGSYIPNDESRHDTKEDIVVASANRNVTFDLPDVTSAAAAVVVTGTVTSGGSPVEDVWVWIGNPLNGYHNGTSTNASGEYSLKVPVLGSGNYIMGADRPGYISPQPGQVSIVDANADGTVDTDIDFSLTSAGYTISGYLFADADGGTTNSRDANEQVANGWVRAEETTTKAQSHATVDGTGLYTLNVSAGTWKVFGMADGYSESQYSVNGTTATLTVTSANLTNKDIKLTTNANWSRKSKSSQITPSSGGTVDDTGSSGTGVKLTIPPNALGTSSSAGQLSVTNTASVTKTNSISPLGNEGKQITALDNSGQPITTLDSYIDIEMMMTKAEVDAMVAAGQLVDKSKLLALKVSYFDNSKNDWVTLATTNSAYYKTTAEDTEWTSYNGTSSQTGFERFVTDALVNETFTAFEDYKFISKASTNHLTIFGSTIPTDGVAPAAPTGLEQSSGGGTSVGLNWADNGEADLLEYEIYRSTSTGVNKLSTQVNTSQVAVSAFTDTTTTAWTSYYYTVTAADDSGNESEIATELRVCSNNTVSNGTVAASCTITCNSGYTQSGNSCVAEAAAEEEVAAPSGGGGVVVGNSSRADDEEEEEGEDAGEEDNGEKNGAEENNGDTSAGATGTAGDNSQKNASKSPFADISGHWAKTYITELYELGIVSGYDAENFVPDANLTRAEITKIAVKAFGIDVADSVSENPFSDVEADKWYARYIAAAVNAGIIDGHANGTFQPNAMVTRAEAMKILLKAAGASVAPTMNFEFSDVVSGSWYEKYVNYGAEKGIVNGYADDTFRPNIAISRAQMSVMVSKMLQMQFVSVMERLREVL